MDADRLFSRLNPVMLAVLRSPLHGLLSAELMALTVTGRRSGRRYTIPVGYQRQGDRLVVLASFAPRKQWWRNYEAPGPVDCLIRGRVRRGEAQLVPGHSPRFREAVEATFQRLPRLGGQFGIAYDRARGLSDEQWREVASNGAVVEIQLEPEASGAPRG